MNARKILLSTLLITGILVAGQSTAFAGKGKAPSQKDLPRKTVTVLKQVLRVQVNGEAVLDSQDPEKLMQAIRQNLGKEIVVKPRHQVTKTQVLTPPQRITVYDHGEKHTFKIDNPLFQKIVSLTNDLLQKPGYELRYDNSTWAVKKNKHEQIAVAFEYDQPTQFIIPAYVGNDHKKQFTTKKLFLVLTGKDKDTLFYSSNNKRFATSPIQLDTETGLQKLVRSILYNKSIKS